MSDLIRVDAGLTANILRVANSAFYARGNEFPCDMLQREPGRCGPGRSELLPAVLIVRQKHDALFRRPPTRRNLLSVSSLFKPRGLESNLARKFLIVEDDPNDALLIKRALRSRCGFSFVCRNPGEAQAYLRGAGTYGDRAAYPLPDVIVTDLRIGADSGITLVEWVRSQTPPVRDTPMIILTGSAPPAEFEAAQRAGAQRVYRKPTRFEDLQQLIEEIALEYCR